MPNKKQHAKLSKSILHEWSMGESFQAMFDSRSSSKDMGPAHRAVDHSPERVRKLSGMFGPVGTAEVLIHLAADYSLVPEWEKRAKETNRKRRTEGE